jgi:hypothetical protein
MLCVQAVVCSAAMMLTPSVPASRATSATQVRRSALKPPTEVLVLGHTVPALPITSQKQIPQQSRAEAAQPAAAKAKAAGLHANHCIAILFYTGEV